MSYHNQEEIFSAKMISMLRQLREFHDIDYPYLFKKINIGSGKDVRFGWDNLDSSDKNGANIVANLNKIPLPIKSNTYDVVLCSHVLEDFVDPTPLIKELIRITRPGGIIDIRVPNETVGWGNIYHKRAFSLSAFYISDINDVYGKRMNISLQRLHYYNLECRHLKNISFIDKIYLRINEFFANLLGGWIMEKTFMKYVFPSISIRAVYHKRK